MGRVLLVWILGAALAATSAAQEPEAEEESEAQPPIAGETAAEDAASQRTEINLLGETAAESGESRRNENVQFNLVDNNALKELNIRLGTTATIVEEFQVDRGFFGSEFGKPPVPPIHARPGGGNDVHGNVFWRHNNSIFSARSFFQVGEVQPARENFYGGTISSPLWEGAHITLSGSQNKIRGNVNGNVLIPLPEERTPRSNGSFRSSSTRIRTPRRTVLTLPLVRTTRTVSRRSIPTRLGLSSTSPSETRTS